MVNFRRHAESQAMHPPHVIGQCVKSQVHGICQQVDSKKSWKTATNWSGRKIATIHALNNITKISERNVT